MKKTAALFAIALALLGHQSLHAQGLLAPDSNPKPTQKSLQEIWQKIEATENRVLILGQTTNSTALQVQTLGQTANSTAQQIQTLSQTVDALAQIVRQGPAAPGMVAVQGGTLQTSNPLNGTLVASFQIEKYEVRWDEWQEVRDWALFSGYGNFTTGNGTAADHPVREVSWYDCVQYCNARSEREGLTPVYSVNGTVYRTGEVVPTVNSSANGYRLPTEVEWEFAARGGVLTRGFLYAGSGILTHVGWYFSNSGGGTKAVGTKAANELGLHDMSGNVWEWAWDAVGGLNRRIRGGGWDYGAANCTVANRQYDDTVGRSRHTGFRLARNSEN